MKWVDVYDIAVELEDKYSNLDILSLTFVKLRSLVVGLNNFSDDINGSNEKILEAIQTAWLEERD